MVLKGGKIYMIINDKGQRYYGSTCSTLQSRFNKHKHAFHYWLYHGYVNYCYSFIVMQSKWIKIKLIETCSHLNSKHELKQRERWYIENNTCVNHNIPARTRKETYTAYNQKSDRKEHMKQYYQLNKEKLKQQQKDKLSKEKQVNATQSLC
jgi:phage-related protein